MYVLVSKMYCTHVAMKVNSLIRFCFVYLMFSQNMFWGMHHDEKAGFGGRVVTPKHVVWEH